MARVMAAPGRPVPVVPDVRVRPAQTAAEPILSEPPTRLVDPADLGTAGDLAADLGVSAATVCNWAARHRSFPEPVTYLMGRAVYLRSDVATWARLHTVTAVRTVARRMVTR